MKVVLHLIGRQKPEFRLGMISSAAFRSLAFVSPLIAVGFAGSAGAAEKFYMTMSPTTQQTVRYERGVAQLSDESGTAIVKVTQDPAPDGRLALGIVVLNQGRAPFNLGPENIQISTADGKILPIIPYERLVAREEGHQKRQRFWSRVAAAGRIMSASGAGNVSQSGTYTGNSSGSVGGTPYAGQTMGTFYATYHDPAAEAAARREAVETNAAEAEALAAKQAHDMAAYDSVLRTTTIDPGTVGQGTVQFEVPQELRHVQGPVLLQMTVMLNGELHRFAGRLRAVGG